MFRLLAIVVAAAAARTTTTLAYQPQPPPSPRPRAVKEPVRAPAPTPAAVGSRRAGAASRSGFLWGVGGAVAAAAAAATGAPGAAQAIVDVGLRKEYIDPSEFFRIEYPIGACASAQIDLNGYDMYAHVYPQFSLHTHSQ